VASPTCHDRWLQQTAVLDLQRAGPTPTEDTKAKKIVGWVDAYESDFGTIQVAPNRFMRTRDVLVPADRHVGDRPFSFHGRKMVSVNSPQNRRLASAGPRSCLNTRSFRAHEKASGACSTTPRRKE